MGGVGQAVNSHLKKGIPFAELYNARSSTSFFGISKIPLQQIVILDESKDL